MASRRGRRGERIEPVMGAAPKAPDLRIDPSDRPAGPSKAGNPSKAGSRAGASGPARPHGGKSVGAEKKALPKANENAGRRRKPSAPAKAGSDDAASRASRPASARKRRKARRKGGSNGSGRFTRLFKRGLYWGMVAGVWGFIVVAGTLAYFAAPASPKL